MASSKRGELSATPIVILPSMMAQYPFFERPHASGVPFRTNAPTIFLLSLLISAAWAQKMMFLSFMSGVLKYNSAVALCGMYMLSGISFMVVSLFSVKPLAVGSTVVPNLFVIVAVSMDALCEGMQAYSRAIRAKDAETLRKLLKDGKERRLAVDEIKEFD